MSLPPGKDGADRVGSKRGTDDSETEPGEIWGNLPAFPGTATSPLLSLSWEGKKSPTLCKYGAQSGPRGAQPRPRGTAGFGGDVELPPEGWGLSPANVTLFSHLVVLVESQPRHWLNPGLWSNPGHHLLPWAVFTASSAGKGG